MKKLKTLSREKGFLSKIPNYVDAIHFMISYFRNTVGGKPCGCRHYHYQKFVERCRKSGIFCETSRFFHVGKSTRSGSVLSLINIRFDLATNFADAAHFCLGFR